MKKILQIVIPVLICFTLGFVASRFQMDAIANWYPTLDKSSLTPPAIVFPIVWSILYLLMGVSIGLALNTNSSNKSSLVNVFLVQLLLNFAWSITFFYFQNPLLGLIDIVLLEIVIIYYAIKAYPINKISSYLFVPYIAWVALATYLNLYVFLYN